jgi:uncharacterized membrane protein
MSSDRQHRTFRNPVIRHHLSDDRTLGQRSADTIAQRAGSWAFIFSFLAFIVVWMLFNGGRASGRFDPYPYILLNLCLSCLAAIQAPVILMSQNRADVKRTSSRRWTTSSTAVPRPKIESSHSCSA